MEARFVAFALLSASCARPEALVVVDPYWMAILGEQAPTLIQNVATDAGFHARVFIPNPALPLAALTEGIRIGPETAGVILSPLYSGELYTWFRLHHAQLPIVLPLGPPALVEGRTSVVEENREGAFYAAGLLAGQTFEGLLGNPLLVVQMGTPAVDKERESFLRGWADSNNTAALREISLSLTDAIPARVSAVSSQIAETPPAVYILAGPVSAQILGLFPTVPYGIEGLDGLPAPREGLIFRIDRSWEGLFAKAFEGLKIENGKLLLFFLHKVGEY